MGRVDEKVALISGGARGMGAEHARALVAEGAKVVIGDILDEEGKALADEIGDAARYVHLDVTSAEEWEAAVATAVDEFGKLNVLVNNAGIVALGQIGKFDMAKWQKVIDVNLTGTFLGMQASIEAMKAAGGGSIINISSNSALLGDNVRFAYGTSKAGVIQLGRDYAGTDLRWTWRGALASRPLSLIAGVALDDLGEHRRGYENFIGTGPDAVRAQLEAARAALRV